MQTWIPFKYSWLVICHYSYIKWLIFDNFKMEDAKQRVNAFVILVFVNFNFDIQICNVSNVQVHPSISHILSIYYPSFSIQITRSIRKWNSWKYFNPKFNFTHFSNRNSKIERFKFCDRFLWVINYESSCK